MGLPSRGFALLCAEAHLFDGMCAQPIRGTGTREAAGWVVLFWMLAKGKRVITVTPDDHVYWKESDGASQNEKKNFYFKASNATTALNKFWGNNLLLPFKLLLSSNTVLLLSSLHLFWQ